METNRWSGCKTSCASASVSSRNNLISSSLGKKWRRWNLFCLSKCETVNYQWFWDPVKKIYNSFLVVILEYSEACISVLRLENWWIWWVPFDVATTVGVVGDSWCLFKLAVSNKDYQSIKIAKTNFGLSFSSRDFYEERCSIFEILCVYFIYGGIFDGSVWAALQFF